MKITIYTLSSSASPNDIRYVGKTIKTIKRRLQGHLCKAREYKEKGIYTNHNYNWINKELSLGHHIIIEEVESLEFKENEPWEWFEQYWICQFKIWGFNLTNITEGGEKGHTESSSEESIRKRAEKIIGIPRDLNTRTKISKELTGKSKSQDVKNKIRKSVTAKQGRPVLQFDRNHKFIKEWESGAEAARILQLDKANLNACCRGRKHTCGGFIWEYKNPNEIPERRIVQMDLQYNIIKVFTNSAEAERELHISSVLINNVCRGIQPETYHYIFKYYNDVFSSK